MIQASRDRDGHGLSLALSPAAPLVAQQPAATAAAPRPRRPSRCRIGLAAHLSRPERRRDDDPPAADRELGGPEARRRLRGGLVSSDRRTKPHLGSLKVEAATKVSLDERLVNFAPLKITEANFPRSARKRRRDRQGGRQDDPGRRPRDRARPRAGGLDRSQILPKNIDGVKSDPPTIFSARSRPS